jgi:hypothetical protein
MNLAREIVNRALLMQIGQQAILIIKKRTLEGKFLPGSTGTSKYSRTPMPMPFGTLTKAVQRSGAIKSMVKDGRASLFTNLRSHNTWIILQGGYEEFRKLSGRDIEHVTLSWTGKMLRNLKVISASSSSGSVTIGFSDPRSAEIASYHQELGAGRKRVTHKFLGLTDEEVNQIGSFMRELIVNTRA